MRNVEVLRKLKVVVREVVREVVVRVERVRKTEGVVVVVGGSEVVGIRSVIRSVIEVMVEWSM